MHANSALKLNSFSSDLQELVSLSVLRDQTLAAASVQQNRGSRFFPNNM